MKMIRGVLIFLGLFTALYFSTWAIWGHAALLEAGLNQFVRTEAMDLHSGTEIYVVSREDGRLIAHNYDIEIPNKIVRIFHSEDEITNYTSREAERLNLNRQEFLYIEVDIVKKSPFWGEVWSRAFTYDGLHGGNTVLIWAIYRWIKLPLVDDS